MYVAYINPLTIGFIIFENVHQVSQCLHVCVCVCVCVCVQRGRLTSGEDNACIFDLKCV